MGGGVLKGSGGGESIRESTELYISLQKLDEDQRLKWKTKANCKHYHFVLHSLTAAILKVSPRTKMESPIVLRLPKNPRQKKTIFRHFF